MAYKVAMEPTLTSVDMLCLQFVADSEAIRYFEGICRRLGIKEEVIIHAKMAHPLNTDGAPSRQFMSALKSWYDGDGVLDGKRVPNTFAVLCKALRDSRCDGVADEVMKHYFPKKLQLLGSARNETVLMLQGITGSGKSTLGNFILQRNAFNVEASLMSVTEKAEMASGTLQQRCIHVIDMPGLGDTSQLGSVAVTEGQEFANEIAKLAIEFSKSLIMAKKGIHSFLITCRSDSRDQYGTRRLLQYMDILGNFWSHSILCLTHGKALGSSDEVQRNNLVSALQHKTKAPLILRELLEKADGRYIIVESEWQGCAEYQRQKVEELLQLSDDIVEKYGTYNDALLNLGLQHYEKAKMELRHQYDDPNGPEIEEAAFEVATRSLGRILYDLIVKRFAGGDDAENLRKLADIKIKELEIVNRENERLLLQLQEEKEEKRRIEEDMARMKREREAAEAKAEEKERELQKYLKKPTFSERRIKDYGPTICLRGIEVRFSAEAIDEATGIKGKGKNLKSRSGAKKHAREDLKRILLDKDIIRKD